MHGILISVMDSQATAVGGSAPEFCRRFRRTNLGSVAARARLLALLPPPQLVHLAQLRHLGDHARDLQTVLGLGSRRWPPPPSPMQH
jgi:hypothetical protein